jgi:hypothetical protein
MRSRFGRPSVDLAPSALLGGTGGPLLLALAGSVAVHVALALVRGLAAEECTAKPSLPGPSSANPGSTSRWS